MKTLTSQSHNQETHEKATQQEKNQHKNPLNKDLQTKLNPHKENVEHTLTKLAQARLETRNKLIHALSSPNQQFTLQVLGQIYQNYGPDILLYPPKQPPLPEIAKTFSDWANAHLLNYTYDLAKINKTKNLATIIGLPALTATIYSAMRQFEAIENLESDYSKNLAYTIIFTITLAISIATVATCLQKKYQANKNSKEPQKMYDRIKPLVNKIDTLRAEIEIEKSEAKNQLNLEKISIIQLMLGKILQGEENPKIQEGPYSIDFQNITHSTKKRTLRILHKPPHAPSATPPKTPQIEYIDALTDHLDKYFPREKLN